MGYTGPAVCEYYLRTGDKSVLPGIKSAMPGFDDTLKDQDIWDVLAFIKSHWPERAVEYQRAITENDN